MPYELLRDVLRTDDAAGRSRRRWLFPVSMAVHAAGALAYLIIPLAAEATLPTPAPLFVNRRWVMPVAPPSASPTVVPRTAAAPTPSPNAAPTEAPPRIVPEVPAVAEIPPPGALDGPPGTSVDVPDGSSVIGPVAGPPPAVAEPADRRPLKVGGAIRAPRRIAASPPIYPTVAIAARISGEVMLEALIDEQGRVGRVRVLKSVPLLDAAAVDAVRTWRYTPTLLNGVPVSVLMTVTVTFSLQR
jgi:periplasmic protein TonB